MGFWAGLTRAGWCRVVSCVWWLAHWLGGGASAGLLISAPRGLFFQEADWAPKHLWAEPLLGSHWPEQVTWPRPESRAREGLPSGRSFARGCAPQGRRALREEVGCWSLLRGQTKSEAEGQLRWLGASQGVDMPLAISWALARPPQTLSQNLWGGPRSDSHPALTPTGASA